MTPGYDDEFELVGRIDKATNLLLESMEVYDSESCRRKVVDALYLLVEGEPRRKS